ncbi:MAG: F510_1955 family glycosylhydrolase, partial [Candidatus Promineifilaceae bacterium]
DGGQTLTRLGFEGESDFHLMGVGYQNHAIYVVNPRANSRLAPGLHYSLDDGQSWQQSAGQGVTAQPIQVAVHPSQAGIIALATEGGLFLSKDHGGTFTLISAEPVTAAAFSPDGQTLLFGLQQLWAYSLGTQEISGRPAPPLAADDTIGYLAVNPAQVAEMALATFNRDLYLSPDGGQSWSPIAQAGRGVNPE